LRSNSLEKQLKRLSVAPLREKSCFEIVETVLVVLGKKIPPAAAQRRNEEG